MRFIHRLGGPCCPVPNKKLNQLSEEDTPSGPNTNNYEYVDLGLPSGTLWATTNVGAINETDYGLYFQWGDTQGYAASQVGNDEGQKAFTWTDYKWTEDDGSTMSKYNATDGKTVLDLEDDAARANWGGDWHMPTEAQFQELLNTEYCTNAWTSINGVNGRLFTSVTNGNTLFIPAAGAADNISADGVYGIGAVGLVLSSSLKSLYDVNKSQCFYFDDYKIEMFGCNRYIGCPVRGVIG